VVDGKLIKDDGLFAVERTAAVSRLIDAGVLLGEDGGLLSHRQHGRAGILFLRWAGRDLQICIPGDPPGSSW
jgi:hypothetical protein